ncbi:hypothetical protein D4764_05G0000280 [Takifugu flavidus]|uniref:Uncharacterized protein n=1 Tax=Takifugu flavidus TaxID=433684 RepID=A0A5C6MZT2_9TELE|nr:hypothetical protein D4764_05G0000280 [Takifugu flavidus]
MTLEQLTMILRSLCGPHLLVRMPDNIGAPTETTNGVLGDLLPDLDQGITEPLDRLRINLDGPKHRVPEELPADSSHMRVRVRTRRNPGGTQVPKQQRICLPRPPLTHHQTGPAELNLLSSVKSTGRQGPSGQFWWSMANASRALRCQAPVEPQTSRASVVQSQRTPPITLLIGCSQEEPRPKSDDMSSHWSAFAADTPTSP